MLEGGGIGLAPSEPTWTAESDPQDIIAWALASHPDLLMTSGFNINGSVLLDLAVRAGFRGKVVFVDTGYHFAETLKTRDLAAERYPEVELLSLSAGRPDDRMFSRDVERCCALRKVEPLRRYLEREQPSALLSARSRMQAESRAELQVVELSRDRVKVNPLAFWTRERLESYAKEHELPVNPLYWDGFLSIGCAPCTRAVRPGEAPRAGRWENRAKTECGLWDRL